MTWIGELLEITPSEIITTNSDHSVTDGNDNSKTTEDDSSFSLVVFISATITVDLLRRKKF